MTGFGAQGFREWRAAEKAPPPSSLQTITDNPDMVSWFSHVNSIEKTIDKIGCYEIRDVKMRNHGLLFHGDQYIRESSHIADVAYDYAMNSLNSSSLNKINSEKTGISIIGPGYRVYGHWLVDFIPRIKIAQEIYGKNLEGAFIPLPIDTPSWALTLIETMTGLRKENILYYDINNDIIVFSKIVVPSYIHGSYHFHPAMKEFYPISDSLAPNRKICISRENFEGNTDGVLKKLIDRVYFETYAVSRGYELIKPELLRFSEQIEIFKGAKKIVGEYGSALHNSLFSSNSTVVGMIRCPNDVQLRISALQRHSTVLLLPEKEWIADTGAQAYSLSHESIEKFFDAMDL